MAIKKELTILFTTRNNLYLLQGAINSLLTLYPWIKNNIIVFDDNSLDETKNWLEENKIKRITWKKYKDLYFFLQKQSSQYADPNIRYNYILRDAYSQITTNKVLVCHSDVLFLKHGFIEKLFEYSLQGSKIICPVDATLTIEDPSSTKYKNQIVYKNNKAYLNFFFAFFFFIDLKFLKEKDILFDSIIETDYMQYYNFPKKLKGISFKYGIDWYYWVIKNKIPYVDISSYKYTDQDYSNLSTSNYYVFHLYSGTMRTLHGEYFGLDPKIELEHSKKQSYMNNIKLSQSESLHKEDSLKNTYIYLKNIEKNDPITMDIIKKYYTWLYD